jgi:Ser/Thr protein kinase RdoA (MazF antagonist)
MHVSVSGAVASSGWSLASAYHGLIVVEELIVHARAAFGWEGDIEVSVGPRGALGQIWRVEIGPARYALKEILAEPPTEASIQAELAFARRAAEAGVRVPASHPDRDGRHVLTTPGGTWLRCHDWIDLRPVARTAPDTPRRLGALLARLHRCAPATAVEPDGGPPDPWYDRVPAPHEWTDVSTSGASWSTRLADRLTTLPQLCAAVEPADPARLVVCHRDLHPQNVHVDPAGVLVLVDVEELGPAEPGRELARALFDWFCDEATTDLDAVRVMVESYLSEGGPGRVTEPADFSMLVAHRLNFMLEQARLALDPHADLRRREWAEREIDELMHIMPTPDQLADVLAVTRDCVRAIPH